MWPCRMLSVSAAVLDIEGTTTSISYVAEHMFPFVRRELSKFLATGWDTHQVQDDVESLRALAAQDAANNVAGVPAILAKDADDKQAVIDSVITNILWQMDMDRKSTALKSLQGRILVVP
eukprot:TRINITY_DN11560_c0_g1_i1.p2 TRINITY_DN11560_c0_g1~~TRINITY_DN11560_c0_g1_i1.p2  ORF type:complete len:120 (+),score=31.02 TRINITY_DN11560_c0_g1_i1:166-525(+)